MFATKGYSDTADPAVADYIKQTKALGLDTGDDVIETGYATVMLMYEVAKKVGFEGFDGRALANFLNDPANTGFPMPLQKPIAIPGPKGFPQQRTPFVQIAQYQNGKFVPATTGTDGGWVNGYTGGPLPSGS
jgi:hypothetical protein